MIFLGIGVLIVGIAALIVRAKKGKAYQEIMLTAGAVGFGGIVAGIGLIGASMLTIVPAGHVGVPVVFGKVTATSISEGLNFKNPFAIIEKLSVRTMAYTMSSVKNEGTVQGDDAIQALSKDGLTLPLDVTVSYRLVAGDSSYVYQSFGRDYVTKILRPASRTAIRDATSKFTFQECYSTKREELALEMEKLLIKRIKDLISRRGGEETVGFAVDQVMLRNVVPPKKVKDAIEAKLAAEQDAQRMAFILQKEEQEAKRKGIEAKGIRDFQKIVMEGITPSYLTWKGIETTKELAESPNAKVIVIGSGENGLPLILGGN